MRRSYRMKLRKANMNFETLTFSNISGHNIHSENGFLRLDDKEVISSFYNTCQTLKSHKVFDMSLWDIYNVFYQELKNKDKMQYFDKERYRIKVDNVRFTLSLIDKKTDVAILKLCMYE